MGNKVTDEQVSLVRSVVGDGFSEMDVIRALHLANNDASAAINIIFDMSPPPLPGRPCNGSGPRRPPASDNQERKSQAGITENPSRNSLTRPSGSVTADPKLKTDINPNRVRATDWWLVGSAELTCLSTCKGRALEACEKVSLSFPSAQLSDLHGSPSPGKLPAKGHRIAACSGIVRFSTEGSGEIGRIPNEWARCLIPLVASNKIRVEGRSKSTHPRLSIMDSVTLCVNVYMDISTLRRYNLAPVKLTRTAAEESTFLPLPSLFKLLGLTPFKKASLTPDDLCIKKRALELKETTAPGKSRKLSPAVVKVENELEDDYTAFDNIVGFTNISELEEMDPPNSLVCKLWPYQKQALYWMVNVERGKRLEEAATSLHPCWDAYHLADERQLVVYVNVFSGDATTEFPSTSQMAKGGILADTMGLGKTVMTISLLLTHCRRGGLCTSTSIQETGVCNSDAVDKMSDESSESLENVQNASGESSFRKLMRPGRLSLIQGSNLIVCPLTLLGQWKTEIETHTKPGSISVYAHYGQSRPKDAQHLAGYDVVLTTYGVLSSEFIAEKSQENGGLYCVQWFRVVLDEAHTIKSSRSQVSLAAASLNAGLRWCLTGTPIQNNLEDVFSLLRFLKVEPWANWNLWNKFVQKPYEEGDEHGLKQIQSILRPIMLRRTKLSKDKEGRPIVHLPPINTETIYCELNETERDFYEALFKRSKVKFNQFVEQGRVLHNYASILELLLRLRQCCDHPFLVLSRGDTQDFADLNKLAKRLLSGDQCIVHDSSSVPSKAYIKEVVEELQKGEKGECPICLEVFEDAVITPCAHRICRECLLTSWKSPTNGFCPICRNVIKKHDLITAPTETRFHLDVEKNWVESSKISALFKELEVLRSCGSKSIIFSQWTAFLDLLEIPLSRKSFRFVRLDGTLNQQQRENVISQFGEEDDTLVLLMSLKAGGVGINLTAASNAFLMDPWWNPAVEEQAVMRIHRIGQNKSVSVKRFIVKGTVEERMEIVQARKQRMISGALTEQEVRTARIEELKLLFT